MVLHCRDAWEDCLAILEEHWRDSGLGGIFHCFTGTIEEARRGIEMGFLVSFAGNVTYPKAQNLREVGSELAAGVVADRDRFAVPGAAGAAGAAQRARISSRR